MARILFIRHAEIGANVDRLWHGSTDSDLTQKGERQRQALGKSFIDKNLNISAVYSSPLKRTLKTAQAVAGALKLEVQPQAPLQEWGIGVLEGTPYETLVAEHDFFNRISADGDYAPDGGESINQVADRMERCVTDLARQHQGETIVMVSHGAIMGVLFAKLKYQRTFPFHEFHMSNTGISEVSIAPELHIHDFDNVQHLEGVI